MGRHEIKEDGVSYSVSRMMENEEKNMRVRILIIRRKCYRFAMHSGTHVSALIALHVVSLYVLKHIPFVPH